MKCPYCGKEMKEPQREHFFPESLMANEWDFWACRKCNHIKREHIVYPTPGFFKNYPPELSITKFKMLWKNASMCKYLMIVPAKSMRESFNCGKWIPHQKIFSIEERIIYELDKMKEIYTWASSLIENNSSVQALVCGYSWSSFYLLCGSGEVVVSPYKEVKVVCISEYVESCMRGALVVGSGKNYLWKTTTSYVKYFQELFSTPTCKEMLETGKYL